MRTHDEIVIISGKGGTGKTSIASALLYHFRDIALGADCDVDGSNFPILFAPEVEESSPFYSGEVAAVDPALCRDCGLCIEVCRFDAVSDSTPPCILSQSCEGCGYCARVCPARAITMSPRFSGTVNTSRIRTGGHMVHGDLTMGGENSGKLVASVRETAVKKAKATEKHLIITDGSPGIGCPVVSSLSGASLALLVAEPTLSGIHDLERIATIVTSFSIPGAIVINKADINRRNRDRIVILARRLNLPVVAEFPFSDTFSKALHELKSIAEFTETDLPDHIAALGEKLLTLLQQQESQ